MLGQDSENGELPPEEPLLSNEETNALLDAMREEETRGNAPEARATQLGSPEGPLREALGRADAAAVEIGKAAQRQLLKQTARGTDVEFLPAEIVPRDVLSSSIDPRALVYSLRFKDESQGLIVIDAKLARYILDSAMGAPEEEEGSRTLPTNEFSELDRRIIEPFPASVTHSLATHFLSGFELDLTKNDGIEDANPGVRFEPMLRFSLRFTAAAKPVGEVMLALTAGAVSSGLPKSKAEQEEIAMRQSRMQNARAMVAMRLQSAEVLVTAVLGRCPSSVRTLLSLQKGDVLRLDGTPGRPVDVCVDDVVLARGNPVVHRGDLAVEVAQCREKLAQTGKATTVGSR